MKMRTNWHTCIHHRVIKLRFLGYLEYLHVINVVLIKLSALAFCLAGNTYLDLDYSRYHKNRISWELFYYTLLWRNTVYWTTEHISTFAVKARWLSRAFHSVAGLMRASMYYYTYSMRCNWWFWEKPLGIFKFSVSSFNFCVCRSVKIQNGNDNNVLHLVLTTSSSLNIEAVMIKICFAQWPDNYNNYISTIIVVNCCTALY